MSIANKDNKIIQFLLFLILFATYIFANLEIQKIALAEDLMSLSLKWKLFQYASWFIPFFMLLLLVFSGRIRLGFFASPTIRKITAVLLVGLGIGVIVFLYNGAGSYQRFFDGYFMKSLLVAISISCTYTSLKLLSKYQMPVYLFTHTMVIFGSIFVLIRLLETVASTPFSLAWSEGNFIYLASLYFSKRIYGVESAVPYIMSTRHLLEGIPYALGTFSIEFHRGWLVFLNILSVSLFAGSVIKRYKIAAKWQAVFFLWSILYSFQGVIYYNILLSATIVLWGFDSHQKKRSFLLVLIASFFGGMNRINWAFTPPLLAVLIYLLESTTSFPSLRDKIRFLVYPAILFVTGSVVGMVGLFGYYIGYGGYTFQTFLARMQADSLLSRLLPSDTFPLGVILASLLVTIVLWYFIFREWRNSDHPHLFNRRLIVLINLLLFGGSLLVSAKIGGGADLHNMDAYLVSVFITFAGTFLVVFQGQLLPAFLSKWFNKLLLLILFLIPVFWQVNYIDPLRIRTGAQEYPYLNELQTVIAHYQAFDERPVLFVTQRQLLTFGTINNVELVPEYELVDMFEMVMAENEDYLNQFREELAGMTYALIIIDPQPKEIVYGRVFNEESNKWYAQVTQYLYESYDLVYEISLPASPIQIYAAKDIGIERQHSPQPE